MLVELSVVEQRYQAVIVVIRDGVPIVKVAHRFDVSRHPGPSNPGPSNPGGGGLFDLLTAGNTLFQDFGVVEAFPDALAGGGDAALALHVHSGLSLEALRGARSVVRCRSDCNRSARRPSE